MASTFLVECLCRQRRRRIEKSFKVMPIAYPVTISPIPSLPAERMESCRPYRLGQGHERKVEREEGYAILHSHLALSCWGPMTGCERLCSGARSKSPSHTGLRGGEPLNLLVSNHQGYTGVPCRSGSSFIKIFFAFCFVLFSQSQVTWASFEPPV